METHFAIRRSIRLRTYDYRTVGAYFVTICTFARGCILGNPDHAHVVSDAWESIPAHFPHTELDEFVVMPNHVHGLLWIHQYASDRREVVVPRARASGAPPGSLGAIVGAFKSYAARQINASRGTPGTEVWQRNYYERVIRNDRELDRARQYIVDNPAKWAEDKYNPAVTPVVVPPRA